jgi:signal peptidase I
MHWLARRWVIWPLIAIGAVGLVLAALAMVFLAPFQVPAGGMLPALEPGDHFHARRLGPDDPVGRGQVLVFENPENRQVAYIKRCVAMGGDTVEVRDGVLLVNGEVYESALDDPGADNSCVPGAGAADQCPEPHARHEIANRRRAKNWSFGPQVVPAGHLFMMGDNRDNSLDSRYWGAVPRDHVRARALWIYWSRDPARIGRKVR